MLGFDVEVKSILSWMLGFEADRVAINPEVLKGAWGQFHNLTPRNLYLTALNHLSYTVVIPGVGNTRSARAFEYYAALGPGMVSWAVCLAMLLGMTLALVAAAARNNFRARPLGSGARRRVDIAARAVLLQVRCI